MLSLVQRSAPWREPTAALAAFADEPWAALLLSDGARGRWSYLVRDPAATLAVAPDDRRDPFQALKQLLESSPQDQPDGPPFKGGVVGLAAYELAARFEALDLPQAGWPQLLAARYEALLAFDHLEREIVAIGRGPDRPSAQARADQALTWLEASPRPASSQRLAKAFEPPEDRPYEAAVAEVVSRICAGEIFQANIARAWTGRLADGVQPFDVFSRLASQSPAPFATYLRAPGLALVSNSPERFLAVSSGQVTTQPIKGTRPRGDTVAEDLRLAEELRTSQKDRAENLMIVDLMRNDLARCCAPGSVAVPTLWSLESYANVHHLVSTVTGTLADGADALDMLAAAFPPGSITGAPKVQAMKVIAGLEAPRGPYCGSLFWAGFDGDLDSSVLIRTIACVQDSGGWSAEARAGAGIVADSDPAAERMETQAKIAAIARALTELPE